jgi:putative phosphoesterase
VRVGLISDTHGMVRPEVLPAFEGVDRILHAGDVGGWDVLSVLARVAPVEAVFGNTDLPGDPQLSAFLSERIEGLTVHVSHGHELGSPTPARLLARYDADVIVYGHTHRPLIHRVGARCVVNPGSAGPRRFDLQPSVAILTLRAGRAEVELVLL